MGIIWAQGIDGETEQGGGQRRNKATICGEVTPSCIFFKLWSLEQNAKKRVVLWEIQKALLYRRALRDHLRAPHAGPMERGKKNRAWFFSVDSKRLYPSRRPHGKGQHYSPGSDDLPQDGLGCLKMAPKMLQEALRPPRDGSMGPNSSPEKPRRSQNPSNILRQLLMFAFSPFRFRWPSEASRWMQEGPRGSCREPQSPTCRITTPSRQHNAVQSPSVMPGFPARVASHAARCFYSQTSEEAQCPSKQGRVRVSGGDRVPMNNHEACP